MRFYLVLQYLDGGHSVVELFERRPVRSAFSFPCALFSVSPDCSALDLMKWKAGSYVSTEKIREVKSW